MSVKILQNTHVYNGNNQKRAGINSRPFLLAKISVHYNISPRNTIRKNPVNKSEKHEPFNVKNLRDLQY
ncbi:hypothetical protein IQ37_17395 [Chryseobacterium piperi]|uniref:Uncharacterized protein n=1 Tax=Chryseobacterium piperi TaxID=558152 RepID=A0A086AK46_9FLAO|nr:hypothetical protein CJF12_19990 [Chryseobacterium piperi]KFF17060.1 hypothetical protein IQ37_17395 [Chryseobacterium piperi]